MMRPCAIRPTLLVLGATLALGCDGESPVLEKEHCIYFGTAEENYLQMSPAGRTVFRDLEVHLEGFGEPGHCTATHVAGDLLLTARHCVSQGTVTVARLPCEPEAPLEIIETILHPDLDLALLRLAGTSSSQESFAIGLDAPQSGAMVELAGYGVTHEGTVAALHFVVEQVREVDEVSFVVDGGGTSGACTGDSGGPALTRGPGGAIVVVGVLSSGSVDCVGVDRYVRLDAAAEWVFAHSPIQREPECQGLSAQGGCFDGRAIWCESERPRVQECGEGETCTFDPEEERYGCVFPVRSPCAGQSQLGTCLEGQAQRCESGLLIREDCSACSRREGRASCVEDSSKNL